MIAQMLPSIAYGDAVSNDTLALKNVIKELEYNTNIYAENIDPRLSGTVLPIKKMPLLNKNDIILYHLSTGTKLNYTLQNYNCRKVIIYHNITPPGFFINYNKINYNLANDGLDGAKFLSDKVDYCLADSEFNKQCLQKMNFKCKIDVLPILIPFNDYNKKPNKGIINKFNDGKINIVFTGRITPNKKQEDIIQAFYFYKKNINRSARLFLVGSYSGMERYYEQLKTYVNALELKDVYFTGHIKFDEILAYYKIADLFLCMSEHEGFCVPLVEAMYFNVPVIAYDSTAISDTLGESGMLVKEKEPIFTAELINKVLTDKKLREDIISNQKKRLKDFDYDIIKDQFKKYIQTFIEENYE